MGNIELLWLAIGVAVFAWEIPELESSIEKAIKMMREDDYLEFNLLIWNKNWVTVAAIVLSMACIILAWPVFLYKEIRE